MKLTVKNTRKKKVQISDMHGAIINGVKSFDTKTGDIELYLLGKIKVDNREITRVVRSKRNARKGSFIENEDGSMEINSDSVVIKTKIKGAYATVNGKRIK